MAETEDTNTPLARKLVEIAELLYEIQLHNALMVTMMPAILQSAKTHDNAMFLRVGAKLHGVMGDQAQALERLHGAIQELLPIRGTDA